MSIIISLGAFAFFASMGRHSYQILPLLGAALVYVFCELIKVKGRLNDKDAQLAQLESLLAQFQKKTPAKEVKTQQVRPQEKVESSEPEKLTPIGLPPELEVPPSKPTAEVRPNHPETSQTPIKPSPYYDSEESSRPQLSLAPLIEIFVKFFSTGNVFAKVGAIVLFFGVAFLIRLVSEAGLFPIEFRMLGAALGANILIAIGWRLRNKNRTYALVLQGTGFGVFFLTVFGAFRIWNLLPASAALVLLVVATVLFVLLSIFQDALSLASLAVSGGFLAPLLTSTGTGSHVQLFTYYALLNVGIFAIAKYRPWRELNLIGFLFTYAVGGIWGSKFYVPEFFASVEPFVIFHFALYTAVVLLFSKLTFQMSKELIVDGILVFGVPLFTFFYQAALLKDTRFGIAVSCAALGAIYVGLAFFLFRNKVQEKKSLVQAFVGSGLAFSTLTVPYALTHIWTGSVWALEGAALVWFGVRQQKSKIRYVGYCLHALAFVSFFIKPLELAVLSRLMNPSLVGSLVISLSAFLVAYFLIKNLKDLGTEAKTVATVFLGVAFFWWFFGLIREVDIWFPEGAFQFVMGIGLWIAALSVFIFYFLARLLLWPALSLVRYPFFALASVFWLRGITSGVGHDHSCFTNSFYLGAALTVLASSSISYFLFKSKDDLGSFEKKASWIFLLSGYLLLLLSTYTEWMGFYLKHRAEESQALVGASNLFVVIVVGMTAIYFFLSLWGKCRELSTITYALPLLGAGTLWRQLFEQKHPFENYGLYSWGALLGIQYLIMFVSERKDKEFSKYFHFGGLWVVSFALLWYVFELTGLKVNHSSVWNWAVMLGATGAIILTVLYYPKNTFPFGSDKKAYTCIGLVPLVTALVSVAQVLNLFNPGNSEPLPYLPLINPLGLLVAFTLVVALIWFRKAQGYDPNFSYVNSFVLSAFGFFVFLWITMGVVRAVHHYAGISWGFQSLFGSHRIQTALSLCWGILSLITMVFSNRKGSRMLWILGSVLMVVVVAKLFFIDLKESGTLERVISFIATGVLLLATGYFAPLPPKKGVST